MVLCAIPILSTQESRVKVIAKRTITDVFRFVIISGYCTINLPRIMFMPQVKLNSPLLLGVNVTATA